MSNCREREDPVTVIEMATKSIMQEQLGGGVERGRENVCEREE